MDEQRLDVLQRQDHRRRSLPQGSRCRVCGTGLWLVLVPKATGPICYRCRALERGRSAWELHHVGGKGTWIVAFVPANLHRLLTLWQDLTWRGRAEPGSDSAIATDLIGLTILGFLYGERD
jgi:hypothetical protein